MGGSSTAKSDPSMAPPYWLKLVRKGKDVKAFHSANGHHWRYLKDSPGKFWKKEIYVGLAGHIHESDKPGTVIIDRVSINGLGSLPHKPLLPLVVLTSGSMLAADIVQADTTSLQFRGRWKDLQLTTPRVARIEFYHPLPEESAPFLEGERAGLLLRNGDFSEGDFASLAEGRIKIGSLLFGSRDYSVLDEADALVFRRAAAPPGSGFRVETHAGSVLFTDAVNLAGGRLILAVTELGTVRLKLEEVSSLVQLTQS